MADPLTSTLRLTQPTVGGDSGAWGALLNSDMAYIDAGVNGILSITCSSSTLALEAVGDAGDQARYKWYKFIGSPGANCTVTLPANAKVGIASNATTGGFNIILTTGGGTTLTIQNGQTVAFYCDGTNVAALPWGTPGVMPALAVSGISTLTTSETGAYVEITLGSNYTITLPTPVNNAGVNYFLNFLSGVNTVTLSTPAGLIKGGYGSGASTSAYVAGPVFVIVSDGTNWITLGNAAGVFTTLSATGLTTLGGALNVTGTSSYTGVALFGTTTAVASSITGTATAGVLSVTGTSTQAGLVQMGGSATIAGGVAVVGTATAAVISVTGTSTHAGAATFGNVVTIAGSTTNAALTVQGTGTSTVVGGLAVGGNVNVTGTLSAGTVQATSTATTLNVTGASQFGGTATFSAAISALGTVTMAVLDVTGTSTQAGKVSMGAGASIVGTATVATLSVTGTSTQAGNVALGGNANVTGTVAAATLSVTGTSTLAGAVTSGGALTVGGALGATGGLTTLSTATVTAGLNVLGGILADSCSASSLTANGAGAGITGGLVSDTIIANSNEALTYQNNSQQAFATGVTATITGWTKLSDRLNANFVAATGVYTAPVAGQYLVSAAATATATIAAGTSHAWNLFIQKNAVVVAQGQAFSSQTATTQFYFSSASILVSLAAGDTIKVQINQNIAASLALTSPLSQNWLSIVQIP